MNQNVIKAVLILLVMFDHNEYAHQLFPLFLTGFAFHVLGFLALPLLRPAPALDWDYVGKIVCRYYYPFLLIVCAMAALTMVTQTGVSMAAAGRLLLALYSGNNDALKNATQMALLWFLPSLLSLLLLRAFIDARGPALRRICLLVLLAAHLVIGPIAPLIRDYLPLGLLPAVYALPLCYLLVWLNTHCSARLGPLAGVLLTGLVFVAVKAAQMAAGLSQELGFALVSDYRSLSALLLNDLESVCGALMLFQAARLRLPALLAWGGQHTLPVYLIHPFVALVVYRLCEKGLPQVGQGSKFVLSMLATMIISMGLAHGLMRMGWVRRFVFPGDAETLLGRK